jgi:curved DNA-binding protein CbpA
VTDRDFYAVLGVSPEATPHQIAQAFRREARAWHPDARPDDGGAAARFREIAAAYHVLADPQLRAAYDQARARPAGPRRSPRSRPVRVHFIRPGDRVAEHPAAAQTDGPREGWRDGSGAERSDGGPGTAPRAPSRSGPWIRPVPAERPLVEDPFGDLFDRLRSLLFRRM